MNECNNCNSSSMEWCLKTNCSNWVLLDKNISKESIEEAANDNRIIMASLAEGKSYL